MGNIILDKIEKTIIGTDLANGAEITRLFRQIEDIVNGSTKKDMAGLLIVFLIENIARDLILPVHKALGLIDIDDLLHNGQKYKKK